MVTRWPVSQSAPKRTSATFLSRKFEGRVKIQKLAITGYEGRRFNTSPYIIVPSATLFDLACEKTSAEKVEEFGASFGLDCFVIKYTSYGSVVFVNHISNVQKNESASQLKRTCHLPQSNDILT